METPNSNSFWTESPEEDQDVDFLNSNFCFNVLQYYLINTWVLSSSARHRASLGVNINRAAVLKLLWK